MANSYTTATGTGLPQLIAAPAYLSKDHIFCTVDGVSTPFTWANTATVSVTAPVGSKVRVFRKTSPDARLVDYISGSPLTEQVLDTDSLQAFYLAQEGIAATEEALGYLQAVPELLEDLAVYVSGTGFTDIANKTDIAKGVALVGYKPPGADSVGRTLASKLREFISVKDFGAVGDGIVDDGPAIQKACYAAAGKALLFPPGTYRVIDGFGITSPDTRIFGYGATIYYEKPAASYLHCVRVSADRCRIEGLTIIGAPGLVRGESGFGICAINESTHLTGLVIQNCHVEGIASAGIWVSNTSEVTVRGCKVKRCLADGIHFSDGCSQIVVADNILLDNEDDNIALVNDTAGSPFVTGFTVVNNYINAANVAIGGGGITLIGAVSGTVTGNTIEATYGGGIHMYFWSDLQRTDAVVISSNKFTKTGRAMGDTGGLGILLQHTANVHIVANDFSDIGYNPAAPSNGAIWITDGQSVTVTANNFYNLLCEGIVVRTNGTPGMILTVNANVFGYMERSPVSVESTAVIAAATVKDNIFQSTTSTYDIFLQNAAAAFTVAGNLCKKQVLVQGLTNFVQRNEAESFTPVIGASGGTITTSSGTMVYQRFGKFVFVSLTVAITTNGTGAGLVTASLPFAVTGGTLSGRETVASGVAIMALPVEGVLQIRRFDNGYPGANGAVMVLSGMLIV